MLATIPFSRTFQERVYVTIPHLWKEIELTVECYGTLDPPDEMVGYRPLPEIDGLEVVEVTIDGVEFPPHLVDWVDSELNRRYWYGIIPEGYLENLVLETLNND